MADNYLEKHYEEYLKRKEAWEKARKSGIINRPQPHPGITPRTK